MNKFLAIGLVVVAFGVGVLVGPLLTNQPVTQQPVVEPSNGEPLGGQSFKEKASFNEGFFAGRTRQLQVTAQGLVKNLVFGDLDGSFPNVRITTTTPNTANLTAAHECENSIINVLHGLNATGTIRLASATAMFATTPTSPGCLPEVGATRPFYLFNGSSTGHLTLTVGGSSTLVTAISATTTIHNGEIFKVTALRVTSSSGQPWLIYHAIQAE